MIHSLSVTMFSSIAIETIKFVNASGIETQIENTDQDLFNYSLLADHHIDQAI